MPQHSPNCETRSCDFACGFGPSPYSFVCKPQYLASRGASISFSRGFLIFAGREAAVEHHLGCASHCFVLETASWRIAADSGVAHLPCASSGFH